MSRRDSPTKKVKQNEHHEYDDDEQMDDTQLTEDEEENLCMNDTYYSTASRRSLGFERLNRTVDSVGSTSSTKRRRSVSVRRTRNDENFEQIGENCIDALMDFIMEYGRKIKSGIIKNKEFVLALVVGFLVGFLTFTPVLFNSSEEIRSIATFKENLKDIFPEDTYLQSAFLSSVNKVTSNPPKGPRIILLASTNGNMRKMQEKLSHSLKRNLEYSTKRIVIPSDVGGDTDGEFYQKIMQKLNTVQGKAVLFIENIDLLKGRAPLALQTVSDQDAAKYKNTLIVLTVKNEIFRVDENCSEKVERYLMDSWVNDKLKSDQIGPIISRVTPLVKCLQL